MSGRVLPYALIGMAVGGLLGYAAHEDVFWDRDENACRDQDIPGVSSVPTTSTHLRGLDSASRSAPWSATSANGPERLTA